MPSFSPDPDVSAQWQDLIVFLNKDADLTIAVIDPTTITQSNPQGNPYNLTGLSVNFIVKPTREDPDNEGATYVCTITNPTGGIATVTLTAADNNTVGVQWYRVDVVGSETKAVKFGRLTVYAV